MNAQSLFNFFSVKMEKIMVRQFKIPRLPKKYNIVKKIKLTINHEEKQ